jgi:hypothetical protein
VRCAAEPALVQQQVEWVEKPYEVVEHRAWGGRCAHCSREVYAALPPEVEQAGLFGPRLTAHVTWLRLRGHVSYTGIQEYLEDVCALRCSRGYLDKVFQKAAAGHRPQTTHPQHTWYYTLQMAFVKHFLAEVL